MAAVILFMHFNGVNLYILKVFQVPFWQKGL